MTEHWIEVLEQTWGIKAQLSVLDGEFDLNIKAECADGSRYIVKVMRAGCDVGLVGMQCEALTHIHANATLNNVPLVVQSMHGRDFETLIDETGNDRLVWVLSFLDGIEYARFTPKSVPLINQLGHSMARLHLALDGFEHSSLQRDFKWNLMQASWVNETLNIITDSGRRALLNSVMNDYQQQLDSVRALPAFAIHNDFNDYNLLVSATLTDEPVLSGIIDFGDMCAAPRVCDLAIAGAYILLDHPQPEAAMCSLISAYNAVLPLQGNEIDLIYPLLRCRLAVSVVNSTIEALEKPDDPYVTISQAPAWRLLENTGISHTLITPRLRVACGLPLSDSAAVVGEYLAREAFGHCAAIIGEDLVDAPCQALSVQQSSVPQNPFELKASEARSIEDDAASDVWLGFYNEPRLIYTDKAFRLGPWKASNRRTVHLGVDVFARAATEIHAPLDSVVSVVENRLAPLDYGGMVVLQHMTPTGEPFYSLYGHLDPGVCQKLTVGQKLKAGDVFAALGIPEHNGGWAPHLHLQLAMSIEGIGSDWPGVADPDDRHFWNAMCPNPAALLNLPDEKVCYAAVDESMVLQQRQEDFGSNLKLSYATPVMLLRGWRHYLFDQWGRPYFDAYNNVPHVGHVHPRLQSVVSEQLKRLNTNTRYLHPVQSALARKLISKMPAQLSVCYFVNSGSEANELALRLSRAYTGGKDIITPDHGYHGNTTGAIDISAYKFNAPGGVGKPDWVWLVDIPDVYGGKFRVLNVDADCAQRYSDQVDDAVVGINEAGGKLAGFIAETFPSVGGQVIPPQGYLDKVYRKIRAAGGVCIADEVQTGLGRLGEYYFAFEQQKVIPDIVVLGKPIGNGHPIGVVVTTREIADSFAQGPEFFSTFGGSTLSCVVAKEVLDIVDDEGLQANALDVGNHALEGLARLKLKHAVIGDVRGIGLFIGVALVTDQSTRTPATAVASYVVNRLREHRILAGLEGPDNNVLKIRPPLSVAADDIDMLIDTLDSILSETAVLHCH